MCVCVLFLQIITTNVAGAVICDKFVLTLLTVFRVLPDNQSHLGLRVNVTTMQILVYAL